MTKRSECTCLCHNNPAIVHITACCTEDDLEMITKREALEIAKEAILSLPARGNMRRIAIQVLTEEFRK